jgi:hypothetical protein
VTASWKETHTPLDQKPPAAQSTSHSLPSPGFGTHEATAQKYSGDPVKVVM